ncbi:MAG: zf-HC2 domain-containing protein [Bacteroidales bacterium]|nr:zf-HC2 domain-containing protein [Bacteroidales bacterium]
MNCKTCKENLDAYLNGSLPEDMIQVMKAHLNGCADCRTYYSTFLLAEKVMHEERQLEPNPFLATRVMAKIEALEEVPAVAQKGNVFSRVWQPFLVTVSVTAAIFIGVMAGSLYNTGQAYGQIPEELVYLDDAAMESLPVLMNE